MAATLWQLSRLRVLCHADQLIVPLILWRAGFEERYAEERRKLAVSGERLATDMLGAEAVKLRGIMTGPGASVEAVESELRRCACAADPAWWRRQRREPLPCACISACMLGQLCYC